MQQTITETERRQANRTVERLLGYRKTVHQDKIAELGILFIEHRYQHIRRRIPQYMHSSVFWKWWECQWANRNYELLMQNGYSLNHSIKLNFQQREALEDAFNDKHTDGIDNLCISKILNVSIITEYYNKLNRAPQKVA